MALLRRYGPPLALMALIFALSAQPHLSTGLGIYDLIARKLAHMTEYGLLWWLWLRATGYRRPWLAAVLTVAYACGDEFHQTFVAGRHGTPVDVGIDTAGVIVGWLLTNQMLRRRRNRRMSARAIA
jgi:VanZ family protein